MTLVQIASLYDDKPTVYNVFLSLIQFSVTISILLIAFEWKIETDQLLSFLASYTINTKNGLRKKALYK